MSEITAVNDNTAPLYNLKAVVIETGLKPPTIRAWERRYGMPQPQRTAGGHRQYSGRDIESLKWLVERQEEGMSISHAVDLWRALEAQGEDPLMQQAETALAAPVADPLPQQGTEIAELRQAWVAACLQFARVQAEQVLSRAFALFPPEVVSVELLQAGLAEIGELWYEGEISVQHEHFASAMSIQRLEMLIAASPPPMRPERIIVASAQDDYHVFSPLLITFLLRRRGWDVLYLGADVPTAELAETIEQARPRMLVISAQRLSTAASLIDVTAALEGHDVAIGYGGLVFNMMPQLQERIGAHYLGPTIEGAVLRIEQLVRQRPSAPVIEPAELGYSQALEEYNRQRMLIESDVWSRYAAAEMETEHLAEVNHEMAGIINAALIMGDTHILSRDMEWMAYLMNGYGLTEAEAREFIMAYYEAASVYLSDASAVVVAWLEALTTDQA